jgi:hypothetical protein
MGLIALSHQSQMNHLSLAVNRFQRKITPISADFHLKKQSLSEKGLNWENMTAQAAGFKRDEGKTTIDKMTDDILLEVI